MPPHDYEVVIVGAGPSGLMMANLLAGFRVPFLILDCKSGPTRESRAVVIQARSLEIYEQLGLSSEIMDQAARVEEFRFWRNGKIAADIMLGKLAESISPFSNVTVFEQSKNEALLYKNLQSFGQEVHWNTEFRDFIDTGYSVDVILEDNNGSRQVSTRWLVACDGSKSPVRTRSGSTFAGGTYENVFYVADSMVHGDIAQGMAHGFLGSKSLTMLFPLKEPGHFRIIGILPPEYYHKPDLNIDQMIAHLQQIAQLPLEVTETAWQSTYRIHHKKVASFRVGNVFFAGDAAHVHSPAGGQGMNTGLQDAYNLAWKLAMVSKYNAHPHLLDTYHEERNPVAVALLKTTDRAFSFMVKQGPLYSFARMQVMLRLLALLARTRFFKRAMFRFVSQTGISYRRSSLSSGSLGRIKAGMRFPYFRIDTGNGGLTSIYQFIKAETTGYFMLLTFCLTEEDSLGELPEWIKRIEIPCTAHNQQVLHQQGFAHQFVVLVRPDNYIGFIGSVNPFAGLRQYVLDISEPSGGHQKTDKR